MGPDVPEELAYVWLWFLELCAARQGGPHGPQPIGYGEMRAWAALTGRRPRPWEVELLRQLDALWVSKPVRPGEEG